MNRFTPPDAEEEDTSVLHLNPPTSFGIVESGIFRSDFIRRSHFGFVKHLGVKCLVVLSPERLLRSVEEFLVEHRIRLVHLGIQHGVTPENVPSWRPLPEELVKDALETITDKSCHPVLVTCS